MRLMSFRHTADAIRARAKTVTRRLGWASLRPGVHIQAVVKAQGLKRGEHPERLAILEVVDVRREPLRDVTDADVRREGFALPAPEFIAHFCSLMRVTPDVIVTRIEFRYADEEARP